MVGALPAGFIQAGDQIWHSRSVQGYGKTRFLAIAILFVRISMKCYSQVRRCNDAGVRIYVDAVINHMTGNLGQGKGTGGSEFDSVVLNYSTVPYSNLDFHGRNECITKSGNIENYRDAKEVRNCKLSGLNDLKLETDSVREKIVEYFNKLVGYGVAGFR